VSVTWIEQAIQRTRPPLQPQPSSVWGNCFKIAIAHIDLFSGVAGASKGRNSEKALALSALESSVFVEEPPNFQKANYSRS